MFTKGRKNRNATWGLEFWMSYCFEVPPRHVESVFFLLSQGMSFHSKNVLSRHDTRETAEKEEEEEKNSQAHNHFPVHLISTNSKLFICSGLIYRKHDSTVIIPFFKGRAPK